MLVGCGSEKGTTGKKDAAVPVPRDVVAAVVPIDAAAPPRAKVFVHGAGRCGECHEKMYGEWEVSAHASAASSSLYKAAVARAADPTCDRCHAPLGAFVGDEIASEGVTCDVCHTLREPTPHVDGARFRLAVDDMVKFGPRCDLKDHYFHRMGCSPEHKEAQLCGSCHWWEPKGLPVFTEYRDWRDGPAGKAGTSCQSCHMPKEKAVIATGSPVRPGVPHHGLLGVAKDLRARAIALEVTARDDAGAIVVDVAVTNVATGHYIPAGLPERRLLVRILQLDTNQAEVDGTSRWLGRFLVNAVGHYEPFWKATKVHADTRIAPGATWKDQVQFTTNEPGTIEVTVIYRGLDPAIALGLGITDVEEYVLATARIPFGAAGAGGRAKLPKTVTIKPSPAGKRPRPQGTP